MNTPTPPAALRAAPDGLAPAHHPDHRCRPAFDRPAARTRAAAHRMLVLALLAVGMLGLMAATDAAQPEVAPAAAPAVSRITPASRSTASSRSASPSWLNESLSSLRPSSPG